jgi:hypothetical protein
MDIIGRVRFQKTVTVGGQPCYGAVRADDNRFKILIAKCAGESFEQFAETLLHEFVHLVYFILIALTDFNVSERAQHKTIEKIMIVFLRDLVRQRRKK